jgi:hypothetical protein
MSTPSQVSATQPPSVSTYASSTNTAKRLKQRRERLGIYRNDLLVAVRLVNRMEADILQAEYETFVIAETYQCKQVRDILDNASNETFNRGTKERWDSEEIRSWYEDYCHSCDQEWHLLQNA